MIELSNSLFVSKGDVAFFDGTASDEGRADEPTEDDEDIDGGLSTVGSDFWLCSLSMRSWEKEIILGVKVVDIVDDAELSVDATTTGISLRSVLVCFELMLLLLVELHELMLDVDSDDWSLLLLVVLVETAGHLSSWFGLRMILLLVLLVFDVADGETVVFSGFEMRAISAYEI